MDLRAHDKKLILFCSFEERDFPMGIGASWSKKLKAWSWPASIMIYKRIISEAHYQNKKLVVEKYIDDHYKAKLKAIDEQSNIDSSKIYFKTKPYHHQIKMMELILTKKKGFIFSEVGTGKSKSVIDAAINLHLKGLVNRILVVSPASIMPNFKNEVKIHSNYEACVIYGAMDQRKNLIKSSECLFHIINYDVLHKLKEDLIKANYGMIVFDEVHKVKNRQAVSSKAAFEIIKSIPYRVGVSGTIICNSYEDIFMPYKIIDCSIFGENYQQYKNSYLQMGGFNDYEIVGYKREGELKKLIASNSIMFKIREIKDLPPEVTIVKEFDLSDETKKVYKNVRDEMMIEFADIERPVVNALERIMRLNQITSGFTINNEGDIWDISNEKLEVLRETIEEIDGKVIVFCHYRHSIDRVKHLCDQQGWPAMIFDGRTKDKSIYKDFNEGDSKVWIAQLQTSAGYSIPNAKYAIFYELDHSRVNHIQSKGRNLRISGSEDGSCFYIYLFATDTIDRQIFDTLKNKDFTAHDAMQYVRGTVYESN